MPLRRTEGPLYEYACHEGNIGLAGSWPGPGTSTRSGCLSPDRAASVCPCVPAPVSHEQVGRKDEQATQRGDRHAADELQPPTVALLHLPPM